MSRLDYCKHELVDDCYDWKNNNCDECNIFKAYCEGARRAKASIGSYTGFCKSQLITCHFVKACNGVCPFEDALKHADQVQTMNEQHTIDHDRDWIIGCIEHDGFIHTDRFDKANQIIHDALLADAGQGWIPFTRRPMTEEEQKDYPNCTFIFDCVLPDDGDEILVSNGRFVWMDTFCTDIDGCYLDGGDDIDDGMAWIPLPEPYKDGDTDDSVLSRRQLL